MLVTLLTRCLNAVNRAACENMPRKSSPAEKKYFIFCAKKKKKKLFLFEENLLALLHKQ